MSTFFNYLTGKFEEEPKKNKSPEAAIGRAIDKYMASVGAYMRTIKSSGTRRNGKWMPSAQGTGISDRIGVLDGRFIAIELKAPGKKRTLTLTQYNFLYAIASRGGAACVADCIEDVKLMLKQSKEELLSTLLQWKPTSQPSLDPSDQSLPWD